MVKLLLEDDKPYVIKNGETRKTTGLKNGGQGLPGLATEVVEACLTWKIPPASLIISTLAFSAASFNLLISGLTLGWLLAKLE